MNQRPRTTPRFTPRPSLAWAACYVYGCPHVVVGEKNVAGNGGSMVTVACCEKHAVKG